MGHHPYCLGKERVHVGGDGVALSCFFLKCWQSFSLLVFIMIGTISRLNPAWSRSRIPIISNYEFFMSTIGHCDIFAFGKCNHCSRMRLKRNRRFVDSQYGPNQKLVPLHKIPTRDTVETIQYQQPLLK